MQREPVIPRAVIGSEDGEGGDVLLLGGQIPRAQRREEGVAGLILMPPVAVHAILMGPVSAQHPVGVERVLHTRGGMYRVRCLVGRIDERTCAAVGVPRQTAGIAWPGARYGRGVYGLEGGDPAVLRQIVIEESEARSDHGAAVLAERICDSQARSDGFPVIVRNAWVLKQRNLQTFDRKERGVRRLRPSGGREEAKSGIVAQADVDREMGRRPPGILSVESQPLHVLRKGAIARGRAGTAGSVSHLERIRRGATRSEERRVGKECRSRWS